MRVTNERKTTKEPAYAARARLIGYLRGSSYRSEKHHLHFVATPKVACTAFKWWMAELEGCAQAIRDGGESWESDPELVIHDTFALVAPDVTGLSEEAMEALLAEPTYYRFALVRDPYRRLFSAWQSKLLLQEPLQSAPYRHLDFFQRPVENARDVALAFEGFLEHLAEHEAPRYADLHWAPQASLLRPDLIEYSRIGKLEQPEELRAELLAWVGPGVKDPLSKTANESLIAFCPTLLTERAGKLIRELYAEDFETFGYSLEVPQAKRLEPEGGIEVAVRAVKLLRARHQRLHETRSSLNDTIAKSFVDVKARDARIAELNETGKTLRHEIGALRTTVDSLTTQVARLVRELEAAHDRMRELVASTSWRLTQPLRRARRWWLGEE